MEDALDPLEEEEYTLRPNKQFVLGLAASLFLHTVLAVVLVGLPSGGGGAPPRPAVTYVDLKSIPAPAAPAVKPQPEPTPQPMKSDEEAEPLPETPPARELPQAAQQVASPVPPTPAQAAVEETKSSFGMGLTKGFFKALSDGDSLRPDIKEYYQNVLQGVNEKWWLEQKDDKVKTIVVNLMIDRSGRILGSNIMISSGNIVYDRAVQKMLESAGPLPPVPESYTADVFMAPIRLVPPLNLMSW
ncbi:TonB family protein [Geomonas terrae]|uniref:TonB family protein n=1 Tax=Geomonas terrae TaxID=2562681 RepID=A0A4S1CBS4_9BACT|nr:TonB family protein [Geomonas terrae]TGU70825.1 TonB family protein [Geomonas terrae]